MNIFTSEMTIEAFHLEIDLCRPGSLLGILREEFERSIRRAKEATMIGSHQVGYMISVWKRDMERGRAKTQAIRRTMTKSVLVAATMHHPEVTGPWTTGGLILRWNQNPVLPMTFGGRKAIADLLWSHEGILTLYRRAEMTQSLLRHQCAPIVGIAWLLMIFPAAIVAPPVVDPLMNLGGLRHRVSLAGCRLIATT
jgi:hypothetical protein